ncbi:MAG: cupin domain-containing protein [Thermaceae bacterium]|nr:cupin domain-containing protein [Thermaceae bacterium]
MATFPEWFKAFKHVELWPGMHMAVLSGHNGQAGFQEISEETLVPEHSHAGQWGVVLEGQVEFVMNGHSHLYKKGEYYHIPAGVPHSAKIAAGTAFIDVWEGVRFPEERMK